MSCQMDRIGELSAFILIGGLGTFRLFCWYCRFIHLCIFVSNIGFDNRFNFT